MRKSEYWDKWTEELRKVQEELGSYSYTTIHEFNKVFPLPTLYCPPGTKDGGQFGAYNYYSQNIIPKEGKEHMAFLTMMNENPYETFWPRWNRFKNIRAFL